MIRLRSLSCEGKPEKPCDKVLQLENFIAKEISCNEVSLSQTNHGDRLDGSAAKKDSDIEKVADEDGKAGAAQPSPAFRLFNRLPCELRIRIWKFASQQPRIVQLRQSRTISEEHSYKGIDEGTEEYGYPMKSLCPVPALLHVCRESAAVAHKFYVQTFGINGTEGHIYFNYENDILYISKHTFRAFHGLEDVDGMWYMLHEETRQVKRLAIEWDDVDLVTEGIGSELSDEPDCDAISLFLRKFTNLRELYFVIDELEPKTHDRENLVLVESRGVAMDLAKYKGPLPGDCDAMEGAEEAMSRREDHLLSSLMCHLHENLTEEKDDEPLVVLPDMYIRSLTNTATAERLQKARKNGNERIDACWREIFEKKAKWFPYFEMHPTETTPEEHCSSDLEADPNDWPTTYDDYECPYSPE